MPYSVKLEDTIFDVAYNVSGSIAAIDALLEVNVNPAIPPLDWKTYVTFGVPQTNWFESYTPNLTVDEIIKTDGIPVYNLDGLNNGPVNSVHIYIPGLDQAINDLNNRL